ncbi:MAG: sulfite exporter TauE/SafE family protein [Pseudomonadota bacterium]
MITDIFTLPLDHILIMFITGALAAIVNAFAGGGSFIGFPVLLSLGLPPVIANGSLKLALIPGNLSAAFAYRHHVIKNGVSFVLILSIGMICGATGAYTVIWLGNEKFKYFIPWLLLGATFLSYFSTMIKETLQSGAIKSMNRVKGFLGYGLLVFSALYGGFFGAGLGIFLIATLNFIDLDDIHQINAVKNILSVFINFAAILIFISNGEISWPHTVVLLIGSIMGGYFGGLVGQAIHPKYIKKGIVVIGLILSLYYFGKYGFLEGLF